MSIFRFSNAGGFGTYQRYNDFLAGNPTTPVITDFGSMFPLGVFTLSSAQSTITFSNIPQTYKHLQIRGLSLNGSNIDYLLRYNSDSGNNYRGHVLYGDGSSAIAANTFGGVYSGNDIAFNASATFPVAFVTDILDYTNTNKNKVLRGLYGNDNNGSGQIALISGLWMNTAAITSISITALTGNFSANSSFALYGVQA